MAIVHYLVVFSWVSKPNDSSVFQCSSKMLEHTSTTQYRKPREDIQLMNYNMFPLVISHM